MQMASLTSAFCPRNRNKDKHITIKLTPEIERALSVWVAQQGMTPELLALHNLREIYVGNVQAEDTPRTGADLLALWE